MKLCIGVVLYNPDIIQLKVNMEQLNSLGTAVVYFDNGSSNIADIRNVLKNTSFPLIEAKINLGIATALNELMKYAKSNEIDWVLSMDQDATVSDNTITEYLKYIEDSEIGIMCPKIIKLGVDVNNKKSKIDKVKQVEKCPTSGTFLRTSVWEEVGGYDDDLFIDYVDYDMCIKVRVAGYKILRISEAKLFQNLGAVTKISSIYLLGNLLNSNRIKKAAYTFNHSPKRNYFFVRNGIFIIKKYKKNINVRHEYFFIIKWELKKLLFESNRIEQFKSIRSGIKDSKKMIGAKK